MILLSYIEFWMVKVNFNTANRRAKIKANLMLIKMLYC